MNYLIKAENIYKNFGNRKILENISISIKAGQIITILGPNGGGKSTLAKILCNIQSKDGGKIWKKEGLKIGYMPQKFRINSNIPLTVKYFLQLHVHTKISNEKLFKVAEEVGISHILDSSIHDVSGGERQRLMLARTLLEDPELLILDEPEQGVDINGQIEIYKLLKKINRKKNTAILMIAHDLHFVLNSTDYVVCLNHHICCEGKPEDLRNNESYTNLFGKEATKILTLYHHHHDHSH